jgi:hypothetical protein
MEEPISSQHPFRIEHIFFTEIYFRRTGEQPDDSETLQLLTEIGMGKDLNKRRIQVNFRVQTPEETESGFRVLVESIGIVELIDEEAIDNEKLTLFINEHLLVAMASRVIQLIGTITTQMGIDPIWMPSPQSFGISSDTVSALRESVDS